MMGMKKPKPRVGDELWFVEWVYGLAFDECGDVDRDNCRERRRSVATREEAEHLAREVYPEAKFGVVEYWPARFTAFDDVDAIYYPHAGYWEPTADVEYYEGEE